jgi:plasmid segregation protein ParM
MTGTIVVRAIDVGFGNTKYVSASAPGRIECAHFPSLAFYTFGEPSTALGKRRTAIIPLGGLCYEVGPDIELAAERYRARHLHDEYSETAEYRAMMAGALSFMRADHVDLLVVGLPVSQYLGRRAALERSMAGTFVVGRRRIEVRRVLALAQPQGALASYSASNPALATATGKTLVIDVGARTFDWLVTLGLRVVPKMSDSANRGVFDVLRALAESLSKQIGEPYRDLDAIDLALRSGKPVRIYQKEYELKRMEPLVRKVAEQGVASMVERLDTTHDIEHIVLVGGGAALFRSAIKRRFPKHTIHEMREPLYANVRGFQLLGEQYARERADLFDSAAPAPPPKTRAPATPVRVEKDP